jgi:hypothetical protein
MRFVARKPNRDMKMGGSFQRKASDVVWDLFLGVWMRARCSMSFPIV